MNLTLRIGAALAVAAPLVSAWAADGTGLIPRHDDLWSRWQGRIALNASPLSGEGLEAGDSTRPASYTFSAMSDYYLSDPSVGPKSAGGFRATGGVIIGPPSQAWAGPLPRAMTETTSLSPSRRVFGQSPNLLPGDAAGLDKPTLPYVGIGYTGISPSGGWSFSADIGVFSLSPTSAVKLGRVLGGSQNLDDTLRDMRWSPILQLGVSYSF